MEGGKKGEGVQSRDSKVKELEMKNRYIRKQTLNIEAIKRSNELKVAAVKKKLGHSSILKIKTEHTKESQ